MASRASAYALAIFSENPLVGEAPQSPGKGRFAALPNAPQWGGYAPLRALNTGDLINRDMPRGLKRPAGRAAAPLGALEKTATVGSFPGFGFQHPTSVLQECVRSCTACHDCFRWDWDSRRAWKQPRHEMWFSLTPGLSCGTIEAPFQGFG